TRRLPPAPAAARGPARPAARPRPGAVPGRGTTTAAGGPGATGPAAGAAPGRAKVETLAAWPGPGANVETPIRCLPTPQTAHTVTRTNPLDQVAVAVEEPTVPGFVYDIINSPWFPYAAAVIYA